MTKHPILPTSLAVRRACALLIVLMSSVGCSVVADSHPNEPIRLWAEQPAVTPDREHIRNERVVAVDNPSITPFWPANPNGAAVVVFPGGGYQWLAFEKEGVKAARWLNRLGVAAFVVKYRLKEYGHPEPLLDGLRAVRTVRANAEQWGLDPARIGVLGFSAGGHLAGSVALRSEFTGPGAPDPLSNVSARPDFALLVYPVATMQDPNTHKGSRTALLGENPSIEQQRNHSLEEQVKADIPPLFLVHGSGDQAVPVANSLTLFAAALPFSPRSELHVFQTDRHGFGLEPNEGTASHWPRVAEQWLRLNGVLDELAPSQTTTAPGSDGKKEVD